MPELLLEVGCEELPAPWLSGLAEQLRQKLSEAATRERLDPREARVLWTPRRLAVSAQLVPRQEDREEQVWGPTLKVARNDAGWTPAALGFARKCGVAVEDLAQGPKEGSPESYLFALKRTPGREAREVLPAVVAQALRALAFPKRMSWDAWLDDGKGAFPFGRPIRWLVLVFDGKVVPFTIYSADSGGRGAPLVQAGATSRGHRFLPRGQGSQAIPVGSFSELQRRLRDHAVVLDPEERERRIDDGLHALSGGSAVHDQDALVEEWRDLVEFPTVVGGRIPDEFRTLPVEVLQTVLIHHQKYVPIASAGTVERFAAVINSDDANTAEIVRGMERVVVARLRDAAFFFAEDRKRALADRVADLSGVTFHQKLGTYLEKAERMVGLVDAMNAAGLLEAAEHEAAGAAARLAKADLTTLIVREFPELQGTMGGIYLRGEGVAEAVAQAVRWHYHPVSVEEKSAPQGQVGGSGARVFAAVSLADKLDTLAGYFGIGEAPTGSRDPFGLRRAGQGVVRVLLDFWPAGGASRPSLSSLLPIALAAYGKALSRPLAEAQADLEAFLLDRLAYVLATRFPPEEVEAVLNTPGADALQDPSDALVRVKALHAVRAEAAEDFAHLATAFKRAKNILQNQAAAPAVQPALFQADAERDLHAAVSGLAATDGAYEARLRALASLRGPVDRFFTDVMVMAEEPQVRANRLGLLQQTLSLFYRIADISRLGGIGVTQYAYFFGGGKADGNKDMKDLLGGKGAGLAEMTNAGLPVPPGFTVSTQACNLFYETKGGGLPAGVEQEIERALVRLETLMGKKLGNAADPLLVSVRSGAKFSMPGMMDTILNLGLNDRSVKGLAATTGNGRFAHDSYRRFIQMYGNVVQGIDKDRFEHELSAVKKQRKATSDVDLDERALQDVIERFKAVVRKETGKDFPQEPRQQLQGARDAVFRSWMNPRAITYRKLNDIPADLGTAVNVQAMVFGNKGDTSATGVGFTRNPSSGVKEFYGEFLQNAQGEDVVAGTRTPHPIAELQKVMPEAFKQLREITTRLEKHYKDVQDFEFTIENNTLYMLQTRNGKRTGLAAVHLAVDMVEEGLITAAEAVARVEPQALDQLLHPVFEPKERARAAVAAKGLPASPGAATGAVVFTADEAVAWSAKGKRVVLVRMETVPDDIHGMSVAQGILTATGGMTSHAAVVGRQMGKPCVVGCGSLDIDARAKTLKVGKAVVREGDPISIDGTTGEVILKLLPTSPSEVLQVVNGTLKPAASKLFGKFEKLLGWADDIRRLGVRANADVPHDAKVAFAFGARGIGLCRTEHMFFAEGRLPIVVQMILAAARGQRGLDTVARLEERLAEARGSQASEIKKELAKARKEHGPAIKDYTSALKKLLPLQRADFAGLFREMHGHPVTIRTLDPPLHEFLPKREDLMVKIATLRATGGKKNSNKAAVAKVEKLLRAVEELHEFNPMLGHRGCRLGITYPEITRMQARAIFEAALQVARKGTPVKPEVMIPLVGHVEELRRQKRIVEEVAKEVLGDPDAADTTDAAERRIHSGAKRRGGPRGGTRRSGPPYRVEVEYQIGTMIEVPRGALTADEIAKEAQFFSFGTNDLTQMGFGLSRDDAGRFLSHYIEHGLLEKDPFVSLDASGVGQLVSIGVKKGRATKPKLKIGVCGEHGGDPSSIRFFHEAGLDYVSCSPYRVPIARLAAAQAQLARPIGD